VWVAVKLADSLPRGKKDGFLFSASIGKFMKLDEIKATLKNHEEDLSQLGARALSIFGSFARGEGTVASDIDVLVDFDFRKGLFGFVGLRLFLEKILRKKVDLVTRRALHPVLKKRILQEACHVF
jgi:predicted nucleotidyltransferase